MSRTLIATACVPAISLASCRRITQESVQSVAGRDSFKVIIRTWEFNHTGSRNIDMCVADINTTRFPEKSSQCFLTGYDFDNLKINWTGPSTLTVSFSSGRVSHFTNTAFVYHGSPIPVEFHVYLTDGCEHADAQ